MQRVLDSDPDSLVLEGETFRSAWDVADDWLSGLPPAGREAYERAFAQPAAEELALATQSGSEEAVRRVVRRYRLTKPGQRAIVLLLVLALDRGENDVAGAWSRLIDSDISGVKSDPFVRKLTNLDTPSAEMIAEAVPLNRALDAVWQVEMSVAGEVRQAMGKSLADLHAQAIAPFLTASPLVHEGRVFARQGGQLVAIDGSTGKIVWQRDVDPELLRFTRNADPRNRMWNSTAFVVFLERLTRSSLIDQLSTDGKSVFILLPGSDAKSDAAGVVGQNRLAAFSLDEGHLLWTSGATVDSSSKNPAEPATAVSAENLSNVYFLNTPLPVGRWGLVLGQKDSKVWLFALELHDGRPAWSVPLGQVVRSLEEDQPRRGTAGRIVVHEGRAYCGTAAGSVGCVDLLSRRLLWSARYPRGDLPDPVVRESSDRVARDLLLHHRLPTRDAWQEVSVHVGVDRVVVASPETEHLLTLDADTGQMLWTRPRGDGLFVIGPVDQRVIVMGKHAATALRVRDGQELWKTPLPQPGGRGILTGGEYALPTLNGGLLALDLAKGSSSVLSTPLDDSVTAVVDGRKLSFSYGPPSTLHPVEPRNLVPFMGGVLSQSFDRVSILHSLSVETGVEQQEQHPPTASQDRSHGEPAGGPTGELAAGVHALADKARHMISMLHLELSPWYAVVHALKSLTPHLKSPPVRTAELVDELAMALQRGDRSSSQLVLARLRRQPLSRVYVTNEDSGRTVRLDRWLKHGPGDEMPSAPAPDEHSASAIWQMLREVETSDTVTDESIDRSSHRRWEERLGVDRWGTNPPRITEADSPLDTLYVNTVPLTVTGGSPWEWVTVQVDRPGRNVFLQRADQVDPVIIPLPHTSSNARMMTGLLHGWANGPLLCLRIGTELFGFHIDEATGDLPQAISWPPPGTDASLIADQSVNMTDLQDLSAFPLSLWDDSQSGFFDLFGRPFVQVGPVTAACVCCWDRGHLRALDPVTGRELWSRFRFPVGTHCVGDDQQLVLLRADTSTVEVVRSFDGQTLRSWNRDDAFGSIEDMLSQIVAVNGTLALTHSLPQQGEARSRLGRQLDSLLEDVSVSVVELSTGTTRWTRQVTPDAWAFRVDAQ